MSVIICTIKFMDKIVPKLESATHCDFMAEFHDYFG